MSKRSVPAEEFVVMVDNGRTEVPVKVFYEYRRNVRVASGKDSVLLRIPTYCLKNERDSYKSWCVEWVLKQWHTNPHFRTTFARFDITRFDTISTHDTTFDLDIQVKHRKTASGKLDNETMVITVPDDWSISERSEGAYGLIHRLLGGHYGEQFYHRTRELHGGRFAKPVTSLTLRNMSSKWGSCSNTGKMTLSTRLLFAPEEVQDYVIIHELCHLNELNHSRRYWQLVESVDPDYREKEDWLNEYGHLCDLQFQGGVD